MALAACNQIKLLDNLKNDILKNPTTRDDSVSKVSKEESDLKKCEAESEKDSRSSFFGQTPSKKTASNVFSNMKYQDTPQTVNMRIQRRCDNTSCEYMILKRNNIKYTKVKNSIGMIFWLCPKCLPIFQKGQFCYYCLKDSTVYDGNAWIQCDYCESWVR